MPRNKNKKEPYNSRPSFNFNLVATGGITSSTVLDLIIANAKKRYAKEIPEGNPIDQPIVGFRQWQTRIGHDGPSLASTWAGHIWPVHPITADCERPGRPAGLCCSVELIPNPTCACGIYAYYLPSAMDSLFTYSIWPYVRGAVLCYGKAVLYRDGLRSQHAQIICLEDNGTGICQQLAQRYGVPLIARTNMIKYASEFGKIIDSPQYNTF